MSNIDDLEFMMLLEAAPDRCEDCAEGIAHQHPNGDLVACRFRCPGCIYCPRGGRIVSDREEMQTARWYVIRETAKPPYEVTWSEHATEAEAYVACPDRPDFDVWPRPAQPDRIEEELR